MQPQSAEDNILGAKKMNYDFLLLVRDKKYAQALILGRKILQENPDNPSVQKFCRFIEKNNSEIMKMVEREKQEEEYESVDSDDEQQGEQEEGEQQQGEDDKQEESDENEEEEDEMEEQQEELPQNTQKKQKIELTTCTLNQIPHICPRHHREKAANNNQVQKQAKN